MAAACIDNSRNRTATTSFCLDSDGAQINISVCKFVNFCELSFPNLVSCKKIPENASKITPLHDVEDEDEDEEEEEEEGEEEEEEEEDGDDLWPKIREESLSDIKQEPILSKYYCSSILLHNSLVTALANHLAMKLSNSSLDSDTLMEVFSSVFTQDLDIQKAIRDDLKAVKERDPACISYVHCFLNFKGFLACQAHRAAHKLWSQGRIIMALLVQSRVSEVFAVDIHPGAKIGRGILLDHATGVVIGETAVIGDNVTILHNVTLGGTGKVSGDRHPKIGDGVFIGAGVKVLGNLRIGEGAKIGAGSVVLKEVLPKTTVVGNPARVVGGK